MRWRDILIGGAVTFLVTVLAGVLVWFLTREPKPEPEQEKLRYAIENVAPFTVGATRVGFVTLKVGNQGRKAAKEVRVIAQFSPGIEIKEKQISVSSGPAGEFRDNSDTKAKLDVVLPSLRPGKCSRRPSCWKATHLSNQRYRSGAQRVLELQGWNPTVKRRQSIL